jgi:hypothetical protein
MDAKLIFRPKIMSLVSLWCIRTQALNDIFAASAHNAIRLRRSYASPPLHGEDGIL